MGFRRGTWIGFLCLLASATSGPLLGAESGGGRLSVAVTVQDVESIVKEVGGDQVSTFSLFKGCILRKDLQVEPQAKDRLSKAEAVVWTGFFNESAAIYESVRALDPKQAASRPAWIDVSRGARRINVPSSVCDGYVEVSFMHGNPFFWLNPSNGGKIASNVAEGLIELRPEKRAYFLANAARFQKDLEKRIERWKEELKPLKGLKVFSTQCGWQNFSQIGGPTFIVCKQNPGELPTPAKLVEYVKSAGVQVILVDPNTPPEYSRALREGTQAKVVDVPSSIEKIQGATAYFALFDHLVQTLKEAAKT
jgi:ABC-type Zn uptake system ZnuABC Zn-binding protein ZnuA